MRAEMYSSGIEEVTGSDLTLIGRITASGRPAMCTAVDAELPAW